MTSKKKQSLAELAESLGFKSVPDDDPIYQDGWSIAIKVAIDLQKLNFDPAVEAMKASQDLETEEEGKHHESLRRLQVRQLSIVQTKKREKKNG